MTRGNQNGCGIPRHAMCVCPVINMVLCQEPHHKWALGSKVTHFRFNNLPGAKLHPLSNPLQPR